MNEALPEVSGRLAVLRERSMWREGHEQVLSELRDAADMQKFCIGKLKEKGTPGFLAWAFTRNIPRLKRWQTH